MTCVILCMYSAVEDLYHYQRYIKNKYYYYYMKIAWTSSTLGIVQSRSRSQRDFESFLHLPQYKLSSPISQLWHTLGSCD